MKKLLLLLLLALPLSAQVITPVTGWNDLGNSTTTALAGGATFTGVWFDALNYEVVQIIVKPSHASAADGLCFEWSGDASNADVSNCSGVGANEGRAFAITKRARYFRVKYTNGGTLQTSFRLATTWSSTGTGIVTRPLDFAVDDDNLAQIVRSATNGRNSSTGALEPIGMGGSGNSLTTTLAPFTFSATGQQAVTATATALPTQGARVVCFGVKDGGTQVVYFGINGSVTTSTGSEIVAGERLCRPASNVNVFFVIAGGTGSTLAWEAWN